MGLWSKSMKNRILSNGGSVQGISEIPARMQEVYKTVWELKMRSLIDMAADRGAFIDQSQSLNLFVAAPTTQKLTSMHFYSWKQGLKTGCYYLRTRPAADAIQFTVEKSAADVLQDKSNKSAAGNSKTGSAPVKRTQSIEEEEMAAMQLAAAKLACSLQNKEACTMCSA